MFNMPWDKKVENQLTLYFYWFKKKHLLSEVACKKFKSIKFLG